MPPPYFYESRFLGCTLYYAHSAPFFGGIVWGVNAYLPYLLLLQDIILEIIDKKGVENMVEDYLSRLKNSEVTKKEKNIMEEFPNE